MQVLTQQRKLLNALKKNPVNSFTATFILNIKQAPTRIKELRNQGYDIKSITNKDKSVDWVLNSVPQPTLYPVFNDETNSVRMVTYEEYVELQKPKQQELI